MFEDKDVPLEGEARIKCIVSQSRRDANLTLSVVRYDHDYGGYPLSQDCEYSIVRASSKRGGPAGAQVRDERRKLRG